MVVWGEDGYKVFYRVILYSKHSVVLRPLRYDQSPIVFRNVRGTVKAENVTDRCSVGTILCIPSPCCRETLCKRIAVKRGQG